MCIKFFRDLLFPLRLPFPEQPPDYKRTLSNTDTYDILLDWLEDYDVPAQQHTWWLDKGVKVVLTLTMPPWKPAGVWVDQYGQRHLDIRPEYCNAGVIAHEQAHNSYSLLDPDQQDLFELAYAKVADADPLVKLMRKEHPYADTDIVEAHAEAYRYLGGKMPENLKSFYPRLF